MLEPERPALHGMANCRHRGSRCRRAAHEAATMRCVRRGAVDLIEAGAIMAKRKQGLIRGAGSHRRTEADYMGVLLDCVSLDDWRDVIAGTLQRAKQGDAQARAWLAQYLVGRPEAKAPTPLTVVVNQWSGKDPVAERLAKPLIDRAQYPSLHATDELKDRIQAAIAAEIAQKLPAPETAENPAAARDRGESAAVIPMQVAK